MFNNNYERNLRNKFINLKDNENNQMKFKFNNNLEQKHLAKNIFFDNVNLFNQSYSNNNLNRKLPEQNTSQNKNIFTQNSEKKIRDLNYTNYSKFYGETNNQPYAINNKALNNLNNFQNIHNINTINNIYQNQNQFRYNDLNYQKSQSSIPNLSNENVYTSQSRRSFSEMNIRNTPKIEDINTLQNRNRLFGGTLINYSNQNFYHGKMNITPQYSNNINFKPSLSQSSPINNISNNIINNNIDYNSSNNTINNFYEQMQKEKERKQKDYSEILRQQIEEKKKRKEIEKQKEKEYDLKMERQYQEYLRQQKEIEDNNKNQNLFEPNTLKRPNSNREKTINDIFNENNNINSKIISSIQNSQQPLEQEKIKNRTNYNNFNNNDIIGELKTRNKNTNSSSSFLNSGKGIIDSFTKQTKTVDEFYNNLNMNINNNEMPLNTNTNLIKEDKFGFTFKNKKETEEMIDKIIKEADDYLKGTLQQSFTNRQEKEDILYQKLNNGKNPNKKIEFKGTFGINLINQNMQKTSQFNIPENNIIKSSKKNENEEGNMRIKESNNKNNENNTLRRNLLNDNVNNNIKKEQIKKEKKNDLVNIDELLKGIDLKALNYHSKYEEVEEDKNKNTIKEKIKNEEQNKNMEESMKSISKLVSSKKNNETWKDESLKDKNKKENPSNDKIEDSDNNKGEEDNKEIKKENKDDIENNKKIMNFLSNRKKEKKIKYKLGIPSTPQKGQNINFNTEIKQNAINSSIKLNDSLNPNLKFTFGNGANLLSNQSIKFNPDKTKNDNLSKFTFGQNLEMVIKNNNTSIQNNVESEKEDNIKDESLEDDEEKYDLKDKSENDINYDGMLTKKDDDLKFLDFDKFLDISKIEKNNKSDIDDLCNIRYTLEEEQQQNKKVKEALEDAVDSSDEEELKNKKEENNKNEDLVNFNGGNTLGINYNTTKGNNSNENNPNNKDIKKDNENISDNSSLDKNGEKYKEELKESDKEELDNNINNSNSKSDDNYKDDIDNEDLNLNKSNENLEKDDIYNNEFNENEEKNDLPKE